VTGQKRVALVTGGGSGIGKACAFALCADGFEVVLAGRRQAVLEDAVEEAASMGFASRAIAADVCDGTSVKELFAKIAQVYGRLDLLFNNAGVNVGVQELEEISYEDWASVLATNLTGTFLCTQQAFRLMKARQPQGGRVINNGSISAHAPRPGAAPYTAAKHGVTGLTRAAALEGRPYNIAVGQIDIGNAATELSAPVAAAARQADGSTRPEPQMDVADVARAVAYMAGLPLGANVLFLTIMATGMPFVGRG